MTETVVINTEEQLVVSRSEYEDLKFQLDQLKRLIYGSKSERFIPVGDPQQQSLFQMEAAEEPETQDVSYSRKKPSSDKKKPVRMPISPHLRRVEETIEPESIPEGAQRIGAEVTEVLECIPADRR